MQNALYVEISVIGIILLCIILFKQRQEVGNSAPKRLFRHLIYATLAMLVIDAACWLLDGASFAGAYYFKITAETLYYILNLLIPFLWVIYLEISISKERGAAYRRLRLLGIPLIILYVLIIANPFTGTIFTIDAGNVYHRNAGFYAVVAAAFGYLAYASIRAVVAARRAEWKGDRQRYYSLAFFLVLPATGGVIQTFVYGISAIWVFVAVAIMLMYIDTLNRQISADPLTGINNRRELAKYIRRETADPSHVGLLALIMMDVDDFKQINDTCGHYHGDEVLRRVAKILKYSCKNTSAFLARYGGDEFCIVYPAENLKEVDTIISTILRNVLRWNSHSSDPIPIGLSIGYSTWEYNGKDTVEALYKRADDAMYQVKNEKKKTKITGGCPIAG